MIKPIFLFSILLSFTFSFSQSVTEVFLMDLVFKESKFNVSNFQNISSNKEYNSQPSFYSNDSLVYARTANKATDIALYDITKKSIVWKNKETRGGEYSPQRIPKSKNIAAVRLDTSGLQRLYDYHIATKKPSLLIENLQVAYYSFYDSNTIVASVLNATNLDLVVVIISENKIDTLINKVGRSIHKVPNTKDTMSYTSVNEQKNMDVFQLDMNTLESFFVTQLPVGIQDHIWLDEATLLIGSNDKLYLLDLYGNGDWKQVADFSKQKINNINRLAISPDGTKLAIVAELIH